MLDVYTSVSIRMYKNDEGKIMVSGGNCLIEEMDLKYVEGEQIFLQKRDDYAEICSYRGNMTSDWVNITKKWKDFSAQLKEGKIPQELDFTTVEEKIVENTVNSNDIEKNDISAVINDALGTVFGEVNCSGLIKDEKKDAANTDIVQSKNEQGGVDLIKKTQQVQKSAVAQEGEAAHKAMTSTVNNSTPAPEVSNDTEQIMLNRLKNDPMYMSHKNPDGSFTILEKKIKGWEYEIRAGMNMDTTIGHTKVSIWLVIKRKQEEKIFNKKSFSLSSIRRGGKQFVEHVMNYDAKFSTADANVAYGRLFVLIMENKMKVNKLEPYMNYGEI